MPWLYPLLLGSPAGRRLRRRAPWRPAEGPSLRGAIAPIAATVALLAVTQYGGNRVAASGEFLLDNLVPYDTAFHVGLSRELTLGYPPQVPGVSGFPLGYHLGPDLVRAAALRWAAVDPYDSINRFDVTLGAIALVLGLRAMARAMGGGPFAVGLAGFIPLLADFSFLFAANPQAHWWTDLLRGNLLVSLALSNPVIPALAHDPGRPRRVAPIARGRTRVAVAGGGPGGGGSVLQGVPGRAPAPRPGRRRRCIGRREVRDLLVVALPCAVATAALVLGQGGQTVDVALAPLDLVRVTRESLDLEALSGAALAAWAVSWIVASLGLRVLGLRAAFRALRDGPRAIAALAVMALTAWPLGLLFRVSAPEMLAGQKTVNDAAYLVEQGGPLLWLFTVLALSAWAGARSGRRAVVVAALIALALPASLQFAWKKARLPYDPVPAEMVRAMDALAAASAPGDVVLQRPGARYPPLPVVLIGRRVPYERFTPWLTQFAPREALEQRHEMVFRFFRTHDRAEAMAIASALDARFVALYGPDRLRFDTAGALEPIYEDGGVRLLRVTSAVAPASPSSSPSPPAR